MPDRARTDLVRILTTHIKNTSGVCGGCNWRMGHPCPPYLLAEGVMSMPNAAPRELRDYALTVAATHTADAASMCTACLGVRGERVAHPCEPHRLATWVLSTPPGEAAPPAPPQRRMPDNGPWGRNVDRAP